MKKLNYNFPNLKEAKIRKKEVINRETFKLEDEYKNLGKGKTYHIQTYGCQGNEADSETIGGILEMMGYVKNQNPNKSDIVLLNTCAVRENAENRIWGVLGAFKGVKRENPDMILGICGCMPQEEVVTNKILEKYQHVDLVFGTHTISSLPKMIAQTYMTKSKVVEVVSSQGTLLEEVPKVRELKHKAWVNIMFGCDEFCTYCIVPYTRGKERSRDKDDIINEVKELVDLGYSEVTLLGQNVNAYGKDKEDNFTFGDLLEKLDNTGIKRIRFTTSHPRDLDDKTINAMGNLKSVMPHLHLPVQSGDDQILKLMNRKYTFNEYMTKVNKLKEVVNDISITTDIIVGFPNETEEQFQNTLKLVEEVGYEGAFTFIYSPREGTPAAKMEDNVSQEDKKSRLYRLNEKINQGYLEGHEKFIGKEVEVLVDGFSKNDSNMMSGYSKHNKLVHFLANDASLVGSIVKVRITTAKTWFMMGELCE